VIVGASAAGHAVAQALVRREFAGSITLIGAEDQLPYDRPPLSKAVLTGLWDPDRTTLPSLSPADGVTEVHTMLGTSAVGLDAGRQRVELGDGTAIDYETLVIATGLSARLPRAWRGMPGVHVLRTLDDALRLRGRLRENPTLAIVGGGFLGLEIAASARSMGCRVVVVEAQDRLIAGRLGSEIGLRLESLHLQNGVILRLGAKVMDIHHEDGSLSGVVLDDGSYEPADLMVVAMGGSPNTEWLSQDALTIDGGVVCDARCRAAEAVYAVGDVARVWNVRLNRLLRSEHRTVVGQHATVVADNIMGGETEYDSLPFFWSDQFDVKLQAYGDTTSVDEFSMLEENNELGSFVGLLGAPDRPSAVIGWRAPRAFSHHRRHFDQLYATGGQREELETHSTC
jgi:NADPH-dependent 2,4-dienoyl-CoA reductase/sulfur reductase-like enzyme